MKASTIVTSLNFLFTYFKNFTILFLLSILMLTEAPQADEAVAAMRSVSQLGVELLFPDIVGKQAKGSSLNKEERNAASLLQKLKEIEKGGDVDAVDKLGQTALMHAAAQNNRLAVCWLVAKGADASLKDKAGKTAGECVKLDSVKELLKACCEEKLSLPVEERGMYNSVKESQEKLEKNAASSYPPDITMPLRGGARADQLHPENGKILHRGYPVENLAFLLRRGMPLTPCNKANWAEATPPQLRLLLALGMPKGDEGAEQNLNFDLLLDDVLNIEASLQQNPGMAKKTGYYGRAQSADAIRALLQAAGGVPDGSACLKAVLQSSYNDAAVKTLLDAGVPVPTDDQTLKLLIPDSYYTQADYDSYPGELYSKQGVVQVMLDAGLDPNYTFADGNTLLHRAAEHGNLAVVQALLKKKANPDTLNKRGETPLSLIFASHRDAGYPAHQGGIVQALLKAGANPKIGDLDKSLLYSLEDSYFDLRNEEEQNEYITALKALLQAGLKAPADSLLHLTSPNMPDAKWEEVALMLLERGAAPKAKSEDGTTALMRAGCTGPRIAQKLLDAGVNPNDVTEDGDSAMKIALTGNHLKVAKLLHDKGVRYSGELMICHPDCMQIMLEDGAKIPATIYKSLLEHGTGHFHHLSLTQEQYARVINLLKKAGADPYAISIDDLLSKSWINPLAETAFVQFGPDPRRKDKNGNTLLFMAKGEDILTLLGAGADPRAVNNEGRTPLFRKLSLGEIQTFMRRGVRINTQDHEGNTALMIVVQRGGNAEAVKAFLDAGANPNIKNKAGKTALQIAMEKKLPAVVKLLREHGAREGKVDPNEKDKEGRTKLMQAALDPNGFSFLKECIAQKGDVNARDNRGCTALRLLAEQDGNIYSRAQELLNAKADVNLGDSNGVTPLMAAARYKVPDKRRFRVRLFLNAKANVNAVGKVGNTAAMHLLIHHDDPDTLRMLLDAGAKLDHKNSAGKTMLDLATEKRRSACVKLLNKRKAPSAQTAFNARDSHGRTPLMLAVRKKDGEKEIQSLLRQGADINARDNGGNTALHHLLTVGQNIDARLDALLAAHPDVNLTTRLGTTPLMILDVCADPKERASRIKKLLACHAKVDLKDTGGKTAAMRYVEKGDNAESLQLLLDAGANPDLKNKDGKTLLQLAQEYKRTACVRLLQERLAASSSGHPWWYIIGGALLVLLIGAAGLFLRRRTES